ncbi:hypothetical protein RJ639_043999 [Escallonia herrerae]|uniref:Transposase (putative) gypsy type domain-containing protein n=1 Tax=Escallonia herrerae TaxID=1293975 RepID=A0AA88WC19_9ASTE|nr:hypothetical protein RJ639_043999 [Escallonia herrerae]
MAEEFCSDTILLGHNCVRAQVTLLRQSVWARFCSGRIVFGYLALCSGRVFGHDSARAEFCWDIILLGQNCVRAQVTLLRQNSVWPLALCSGRAFGHDFARAESCSAVWHPARVECSGTILLGQNRVRPFGTLLRRSVRARFGSGRIVTTTSFILSTSTAFNFSTFSFLPANNALGDVKDPAKDEANPKPWYTADEKLSKMSIEDLLELIREYPLFEGWYARLPSLQEPANYGTKFKTGIYEEQVKSGYRLPLHPFALRFFENYHMALGQLVPNSWRKLVGLIYLVQTSGYKLDAIDFMRVFFKICFVKGVANCPRWYYIHSRQRLLKEELKLNKEQQLEWVRIIPRNPVPVGALTPSPAPIISSTFPAESVPLESQGKEERKAAKYRVAPAPKKTRVIRPDHSLQIVGKVSVDEDPIFHPRWTLRCDDIGMPDSQILAQYLVHEVLPQDKEVFQNQTHETFAHSFAPAVYMMYASGSEMLSRFEMARQVAAKEAQQKREAIKEAEEVTCRAEELSKQETNYLADSDGTPRALGNPSQEGLSYYLEDFCSQRMQLRYGLKALEECSILHGLVQVIDFQSGCVESSEKARQRLIFLLHNVQQTRRVFPSGVTTYKVLLKEIQ